MYRLYTVICRVLISLRSRPGMSCGALCIHSFFLRLRFLGYLLEGHILLLSISNF
jgi:hypothetical protein